LNNENIIEDILKQAEFIKSQTSMGNPTFVRISTIKHLQLNYIDIIPYFDDVIEEIHIDTKKFKRFPRRLK